MHNEYFVWISPPLNPSTVAILSPESPKRLYQITRTGTISLYQRGMHVK
jgi:hypothetical protein